MQNFIGICIGFILHQKHIYVFFKRSGDGIGNDQGAAVIITNRSHNVCFLQNVIFCTLYLRNEKAKAEQKLRSCQHRERILERQMSELNRRERVHRLCTRAGMLESFLVCPGELTDDQVMELLKISFRQPEVVLALAKMVHDVHERSNVQNPLE